MEKNSDGKIKYLALSSNWNRTSGSPLENTGPNPVKVIMKKIVLYIGDLTYDKMLQYLRILDACEKITMLDFAWIKVFKAMEDRWDKLALQLKEDKEEIKVDANPAE